MPFWLKTDEWDLTVWSDHAPRQDLATRFPLVRDTKGCVQGSTPMVAASQMCDSQPDEMLPLWLQETMVPGSTAAPPVAPAVHRSQAGTQRDRGNRESQACRLALSISSISLRARRSRIASSSTRRRVNSMLCISSPCSLDRRASASWNAAVFLLLSTSFASSSPTANPPKKTDSFEDLDKCRQALLDYSRLNPEEPRRVRARFVASDGRGSL